MLRVNRFLLAILCMTAVSPFAVADGIGIPGTNRVRLVYQITLAEPFPDHAFAIWNITPFSPGSNLRFLEPTPDGSITIKAAENHSDREFLVIPKASVANYPNPNELADALNRKLIPNVVRRELPYRVEVPEWQQRNLTIEYAVRKGYDGEPHIVQTT